jgi:hypothetical protein
MEITKVEYLGWLAGLYEGEGTCSTYVPISIAQKDTWLLYKLQELYGGSINGNKWELYGEDGRNLLRSILHYLSPRRIKQIEENRTLLVGDGTRTHCTRGHEFSKENTGFKSNQRYCKKCLSISNHNSYIRNRNRYTDAS